MSRPKAFSLLEILVASGLAVILLGVAWSVAVPLHNQAQRGQVRMQFTQSGLLLATVLIRDLVSSAIQAIHLNSAEQHLELAIQPLESVDAASHQVWSREWPCYRWHKDEQKLWRWVAQQNLAYNDAPTPCDPDALQKLTATVAQPSRCLVRQLVELRLESSAQGWMRLECVFDDGGSRPIRVNWSKTFLLRNSVL